MILYFQPLKHSRNIFHSIKQKKEIFDSIERHDTMNVESPNTNFFTNNCTVDIFVFTAAIISTIAAIIILYLLCKHNKLRILVASVLLQQVKEVGMSSMEQDTNNACKCTPQFYIILALNASILRLVIFVILKVRRIKLCKGQFYSNAVEIMLFI